MVKVCQAPPNSGARGEEHRSRSCYPSAMNETLRSRTRVLVTGLGAVTPLGHTVGEFWDGLIAGRSGVGPLTLADPAQFPCKVAAEVKNWDPFQFIERKAARRMARFAQFMVAAAGQALRMLAWSSTRRTGTASPCSSETAAAATRTSRKP